MSERQEGPGWWMASDGKWYPPESHPDAVTRAPSAVEYAGFWRRVVATLIDGIATNIALTILIAILGLSGGGFNLFGFGDTFTGDEDVDLLATLISIAGGWLYSALMESSKSQATLGKMALSLKVTDLNGERISFGKATGRHFGKIVSAMILLIGFMMAGWTQKKQALHDMMAGTLVVR